MNFESVRTTVWSAPGLVFTLATFTVNVPVPMAPLSSRAIRVKVCVPGGSDA